MFRLRTILAFVAAAFAMTCQTASVGAMPVCAFDHPQTVSGAASDHCGDHGQRSANMKACAAICMAVEPSVTVHFAPMRMKPPADTVFLEALRGNARGPEPPPPRLA